MAREILNSAHPWKNCSYEDPVSGNPVVPQGNRWRLLERRLSKHSWLDSDKLTPPWPLVKGVPPLVTFYSFKGGVGRTTSLASCAWQLAREGKRVAIIDLDLEAPGLGALLEAETQRGAVDAIVDFLAVGSLDLDGLHAPAQGFGAEDAMQVDVVPAGNLDINYLEKLARLDFINATPWDSRKASPVEDALRALVLKVRSALKPDYIFLDARAGLHDLAGLSLHGVSHVDVLVGRASEQSFRGLDIAIQALGIRKNSQDLRCIVVHGFAPRDPESDSGKLELAKFQERTYDSFCEHIYEEDPPAPTDKTAAHWPWPLRQDPDLERFSSILSVRDNLFSEQHQHLLLRIKELCSPEPQSNANSGDEESEEDLP
ncbi:tyrosine-protein kinase family protein [Corallococcus sicarius]|uniref:tyrosine-protein kinase family protein n=1 Tax=Corallococcus sicarius TaxID=2316726 RepID=UPI001315576B|nr:P-loop NTPase [Corallococcus sicarius]